MSYRGPAEKPLSGVEVRIRFDALLGADYAREVVAEVSKRFHGLNDLPPSTIIEVRQVEHYNGVVTRALSEWKPL